MKDELINRLDVSTLAVEATRLEYRRSLCCSELLAIAVVRESSLSFPPSRNLFHAHFLERFHPLSNVGVANPYRHPLTAVSTSSSPTINPKVSKRNSISVLTQKLREDHFHVRSSAFVSVFSWFPSSTASLFCFVVVSLRLR